ncbi:MAG: hypothetical protein ACRDG6_01265 [Candidatus Limnocylindria bacterium]
MDRATRFLPILALVLAVSLGVFFTVYLVELQPEHLFPAPMVFIAAWSLAPALAVIGTRSGSRGMALGLTALALAIEAISITSLGGGLIYALFVAPLLLITLVLIATRRADSASAPLG